MPTPAAPEPTNMNRCSFKGFPVRRRPDRMPASVTAEVPWMSSLKLGSRPA